jgi:hypothetical protein
MVLGLVRRAVRFERGMWRSLARWLLRRPDVAPGDTAFAYRGPVVGLILVFFVVSLVEVVAVDLILPWRGVVRVVLLAVGVWGTMLMLGMFAAVTVRPHVVGQSGLRVRYGISLDVHVPWDAITSVQQVRRANPGQRTVQLDGDTLHVVVAGQTTIRVELARPVPVALPRDRTAEITTLYFHADDAAGLVNAARAALAETASR